MRVFGVAFVGAMLVAASLSAQDTSILPTGRKIDWTQQGAGTLPTTRTQCVTADCVIVTNAGSGATVAQINTALSTAVDNTYVLLAAGTYTFSTQILIQRSNMTLRGNGADSTILNFSASHNCRESHAAEICIQGGTDIDGSSTDDEGNVTAGATKGSTSVTLGANTKGAHKLVVNDLFEIWQSVDAITRTNTATTGVRKNCQDGQTGNADPCSQQAGNNADATGGAGAGAAGQFQIVKVTSISGGACPCTVGITPPLYEGYASGAAKAWWSNSPSLVADGVENLKVHLTANGGAIGFAWASGSWAKGVSVDSSTGTSNRLLYFNHSTLNTVRDSYIFCPSAAGDDYSADFFAASGNLLENTITQHCGVPWLHEMGNGNVFSYNYVIQSVVPGGGQQAGFNNHGCCADYWLLEGNDAFGIKLENYFGPAQHITALRNRFWGNTSISVDWQTPFFVYGLSRYLNVIGNVLGDSAYHTHYQFVVADGQNHTYCQLSIYALGMGSNCDHQSASEHHPGDDQFTVDSAFRWGNIDPITGSGAFANPRWCGQSGNTRWATAAPTGCASTTEVPSALTSLAVSIPGAETVPSSFLYASRPNAWWKVNSITPAWPPIGPDVTSGTLSNSGGYANRIPARICFEDIMGGTFGDTSAKTFNASSCYSAATDNPAITTNGTLPNGTVSSVYSQTISGTCTNTPCTWTSNIANSGACTGVTFTSTNSTTATMGGTPTTSGLCSFNVTMTDATSLTDTKPFTITVNALAVGGNVGGRLRVGVR